MADPRGAAFNGGATPATPTAAPTPGQRLMALLRAVRLTTRLWYDVIAPATILIVVTRGDAPAGRAAVAVAVMALFHAGHTYFNDVSDLEVDRRSTETSRTERALVKGMASRRDMTMAGWALIAVSVMLALTLPLPSILLMPVGLLVVLAYNLEPFHLSARPVATQLFWPVTWTLMFAFSATAVQAAHWRAGLPYLLLVVLFMGIGEGLAQDIRDADNDAAGGRRTTVVAYGVPRCTLVAWVAQLLSAGAYVWFATAYRLPVLAASIALAVLVAWLAYLGVLTRRLWRDFDKPAARMTHVGSIAVFTAVNLITSIGVLLT